MDIFDRISRLFSSSDSSSADCFRPHGITTEEAMECEHKAERSLNTDSNFHAGRRQASNATNVRPLSDITSIVTRASMKLQLDLQNLGKNARKGLKDVLSLSENPNNSTECVKTSDTITNLSIFPRPVSSKESCHVQSKIYSNNDSVQKYHHPKPHHSKPIAEEYSITYLDDWPSTLKTVDLGRNCQSGYPKITSEHALNAKERKYPLANFECLSPVSSHNSTSTCHKSKFYLHITNESYSCYLS